MGITERKSREKEQRKDLILGVTKALILEHGVQAISMQDIADAAELSKATLYLYFPSKEAILSVILQTSADAFVAYAEERLDHEANGFGAIKALWESYLDFFAESPDLFVCTGIKNFIDPQFVGDGKKGGGKPLPAEMKIRRLIARTLRSGIEDGTLEASIDPDKIARIVMLITTAIIDNVARLPRQSRDAAVISEDMQGTFELLLRGLTAPQTDRNLLHLNRA